MTPKQTDSEIEEESHETKDGYCCACDYDIAVLEEKLHQREQQIHAELKVKLKKELSNRIMGYDSKDGYSTLYDGVIENLLDESESIINNIFKH